MRYNMQIRRGTAAQWASLNPVLSAGEPGFETDTSMIKVGDGTTPWNSLRYFSIDGGNIDNLTPTGGGGEGGGYLPTTTTTPGPTTTQPPEPIVTMVSTKSSGSIAGKAITSTQKVKVEWWDNTTDIFSISGFWVNWSKSVTSSGEKTIRLYSSNTQGSLSGNMTIFDCRSNSLISLDVNSVTSLGSLECQNNLISSLDLSGLSSLTGLRCYSNSITSLNLTGLTSLEYLECANNLLPSLDISALTSLTSLNCSDNLLTSIRAQGRDLSYGLYHHAGSYGSNIQNNLLSASALNQFFTDLAPTGSGIIFAGGNPGSATCDPTIATAKGYIVLTT